MQSLILFGKRLFDNVSADCFEERVVFAVKVWAFALADIPDRVARGTQLEIAASIVRGLDDDRDGVVITLVTIPAAMTTECAELAATGSTSAGRGGIPATIPPDS